MGDEETRVGRVCNSRAKKETVRQHGKRRILATTTSAPEYKSKSICQDHSGK